MIGGINPLHWFRGRLRRRHFLLPLILILHLFLLAVISSKNSDFGTMPPVAAPLNLYDVQSPVQVNPTPPDRPPTTETPAPVPKVSLQVESLIVASPPLFDAAAGERAGFGKTCDVADTLAVAFAGNKLVADQLLRIEPESRSVANAILFWDARWSDLAGNPPQDAVQILRQAIIEGIRAAPPECLGQEIAGPRFISVSHGADTTTLVLGSGIWSWQQLLESSDLSTQAAVLNSQQ